MKFTKRLVIALIVLFILTSITLSIPAVQTRLAQWGTSYLYDTYGIELELKKATFQFPNVIQLRQVYAPDHQGDTLIFADRISFGFAGFSNNHLIADEVTLSDGKFLMRKYPSDTLYNFAIWLEHFNSDEPEDTLADPFRFSIGELEVTNMRYAKNPLGCDSCTWLDFYESDLKVSDFKLVDSYVSAQIERLRFRDERRFSLHDFKGYASFQSNYMEIENMRFQTDASRVSGSAKLHYRTLDDLGDFLNKVHMEGEFKNSKVSSREFQSYLPQFPSFDTFEVNGSFKGTVNDLYADRFDVKVGTTKFFGDVHITDCTEPETLYLDAFIGYCQTNGDDIQRYVSPFLEDSLPALITQLSYIDLSGHYSGTIESFTTNGEISSNLGGAVIDLGFKNIDNPEIASYNGRLSLNQFDLGGLLESDQLGTITGYGSIEGEGMTAQSAHANLDMKIAESELNGYAYRNITVNGNVADRQFSGDFAINDARVRLDFSGELDFSKDTATLDFIANLDSADLYSTGIVGDTIAWVGGNVYADFSLYEDEWWQGSLIIDSLNYRKGNDFFNFEQFVLNSSNAGSITRNSFESDIIDGYIEGEYKLFEIHKPILESLASINSKYPYEGDHVDLDCEYVFTLKQPDILTSLFAPGIRIAQGTKAKGRIRSQDHLLSLDLSTPGLDLYGVIFDTTTFQLRGTKGNYTVTSRAKSIFMSSGLQTKSIQLQSTIYPDSALISFNGAIKDSVDSEVRIKGYAVQPELDQLSFVLNKARFNVGLDTLVLEPNNRLDINPGKITFTNYHFKGGQSELAIDGVLSPEPYEILRVNLKKLDMTVVNYLLDEENTNLGGVATGVLILNDVFNAPEVAADMRIDSLKLNDKDLGNLEAAVEWDIATNVTRMKGNLTLGQLETMTLSGRIARDSSDQIMLAIGVKRFRVAAFNPYLQGILDNLRGMVEGDVNIAGTFKKPTLDGTLRLPNAAFGVPFLGTDYNFEGSPTIHLSSDKILLDRVKITDTKEHTSGYASGVISHKNLSDLKFDLAILTNGMLGLDTKEGESNYFYGKAYVSGKVSIVGPTDQMNLKIDVEAESGTSLKLPLTSPTEVGQNQFITFVDPTEVKNETAFGFEKKAQVENLGGLEISVTAKMKPEAEVRLLMDEAIGGEIVGKGSGIIDIGLSSSGDLSILGNYSVSEGEYFFNMRNIVSKKFTIRPGSTLNWSGDPFDAQINLYAEYSTRTTLTGLVTSPDYTGQRVRVNLIMHLTGALMNPDISFDIEVPNVSTAWQEEVKNRLSDQDKMTDNAFSLLAVNSFTNSENSLASDVVQQNVDQMASLMSNWAAKSVFGDFADVSVDYNSYDAQDNAQGVSSEWEVGFSKALFDDRFVLNSNIDIPVADGTSSGYQQTVTGDVEVEYKITEDGRFRAKAFNRSNQNNPGLDQLSAYTQGVSVFYQADFNTWPELIEQIFGRKPVSIEEEEVETTPEATFQNDTTALPVTSEEE